MSPFRPSRSIESPLLESHLKAAYVVKECEEGENQREKPKLVPRTMSPWAKPSPPEVGLVDTEGDKETCSSYAQQHIDCY